MSGICVKSCSSYYSCNYPGARCVKTQSGGMCSWNCTSDYSCPFGGKSRKYKSSYSISYVCTPGYMDSCKTDTDWTVSTYYNSSSCGYDYCKCQTGTCVNPSTGKATCYVRVN